MTKIFIIIFSLSLYSCVGRDNQQLKRRIKSWSTAISFEVKRESLLISGDSLKRPVNTVQLLFKIVQNVTTRRFLEEVKHIA